MTPIQVTLGERTYDLHYDGGAWELLEDQGYDFLDLPEQLRTKLSYRTLNVLLWAMLWQADPRPSLDQVKKLVTMQNVATVLDRMGDAMKLSLRDVPPAEEGTRPLLDGELPVGTLNDSPPAFVSCPTNSGG